MSLDDMIKASGKPGKGKGKGAKGGGRGAGGGGAVKSGGRAKGARAKAAPYQKPKQGKAAATLQTMTQKKTAITKHDALMKTGLTTGAKVKVGNLDGGVTQKDIKELFGEIGAVKSVELLTRPDGSSKGVAFVTYTKKPDAAKAIETYNGVPLDGKPLKISLAGGIAVVAGGKGGASAVKVIAGGGQRKVVVAGGKGAGKGKGQGGGRAAGTQTGKGRGAKEGGRGKGKAKKEKKEAPTPMSADMLDADLDSYKATASA